MSEPTPLRKLFDLHLTLFKNLFDMTGELKPLWVLQGADGSIGALVTPFTADDKDEHIHLMRKMLEERNIVRYLMVAEVWAAQVGSVDEAYSTPASEAPGRDEYLMLSGEDRNGEQMMAIARIQRPPDELKKPVLMNWEIMDGLQTGRFVDLFPREKRSLQ